MKTRRTKPVDQYQASLERVRSQAVATHVVMTMMANAQGNHSAGLPPNSAVIVFPGLNNESRLRMAFQLACGQWPLISTGTNDAERARDGDLDVARIRSKLAAAGFSDTRSEIYARADGPHVPAQVTNLLWMLGLTPKGSSPTPLSKVTDLIFVADAWHLPRVVLTYARSVRSGIESGLVADQAMKLRLLPVACACPLVGPLGAASVSHMTSGYSDVREAAISEVGRLERYAQVGDAEDLLWLLAQNGQYP